MMILLILLEIDLKFYTAYNFSIFILLFLCISFLECFSTIQNLINDESNNEFNHEVYYSKRYLIVALFYSSSSEEFNLEIKIK